MGINVRPESEVIVNTVAEASQPRRQPTDATAIEPPAGEHRSEPLVLELLDAAALRRLDAGQWDELAASALEDNPFYARPHVLAGLATIDAAAGLQGLAIRRGSDGRLLGLFPFRAQRFPVPRAAAAANLYQS